jgi:hypothetical protein
MTIKIVIKKISWRHLVYLAIAVATAVATLLGSHSAMPTVPSTRDEVQRHDIRPAVPHHPRVKHNKSRGRAKASCHRSRR